jgi:hypothetical protein
MSHVRGVSGAVLRVALEQISTRPEREGQVKIEPR